MQEIVININYGGFYLSDKVFELYLKKKGISYKKVKEEEYKKELKKIINYIDNIEILFLEEELELDLDNVIRNLYNIKDKLSYLIEE